LLQPRPGGQASIGGSLALGVSTGLLWTPCAGPILGLILTGAAVQGSTLRSGALLLAFAAGSVCALALALLLSSASTEAQHSGKTWRVGFIGAETADTNHHFLDAFRGGMRTLGYVEGQNLVLDYRSADGHPERFPQLAAELLRLNIDLIVTRGTPAVLAAKNATGTIPLVMAASGEPVGVGLVAGLARPGGNVTGLSALTSELISKRIELMRETVAGIRQIAFLQNLGNPIAASQWEELKMTAQSLGLQVQLLDVRKPEDIVRAFDTAIAERTDAILVGNDTVTLANRRQVVELAAKHRLPAMYHARAFVDAGGLMTYGVSYPDLYRRAATFVDKIFKGAKPADLPVEQPTRFELVINLKTAKALGLKIPESFLMRADEVIE
jgi:putative ABC transport system substrate-binding protein